MQDPDRLLGGRPSECNSKFLPRVGRIKGKPNKVRPKYYQRRLPKLTNTPRARVRCMRSGTQVQSQARGEASTQPGS